MKQKRKCNNKIIPVFFLVFVSLLQSFKQEHVFLGWTLQHQNLKLTDTIIEDRAINFKSDFKLSNRTKHDDDFTKMKARTKNVSTKATTPSSSPAPRLQPQVEMPPPTFINQFNESYESSASSIWPFRRLDYLADSKNRLVVLIISCPYLDFVDNLVSSLRTIGVNNFLVVPLDPVAEKFARKLVSPEHVVPCPPFVPTFNSKRAAKFNTKPFKKLTSTRPKILESLIRLGYTIFYCDVDVYWKRNIFELLDTDEDTFGKDLVAMVDTPHPIEEGHVCSCYLYLQPTYNTKAFLQYWQQFIDTGKYKNDQLAIYEAYKTFTNLSGKLYPNNNPYFPSGAVYDNAMTEEEKSQVWLVHNNFIKGHDFKINRFLKWGLWKPSGKLDALEWECDTRKV
jgi:hypothetical protein